MRSKDKIIPKKTDEDDKKTYNYNVRKSYLDKILKDAQSYSIDEIVYQKEHRIFKIKVFGKKEIEDKEMKQKDIQDLTKLINDGFNKINSDINGMKSEINGMKSEINGMKSEINGIKIELKEHIQEFKEFKSDMLSLPTISKELKELNK